MTHTDSDPNQDERGEACGPASSAQGSGVTVPSLQDTLKASADKIATDPTSDRANPFNDTSEFFDSTNEKEAEKQRGRKFRNDRLQQDMDLREKHAERAVTLAQVAVACWIFLFAVAGVCNVAVNKPFLSDQALATLTAGATVNVIAVFLVVVKGLFPAPHPPQQKVKKRRLDERKKSPTRKDSDRSEDK